MAALLNHAFGDPSLAAPTHHFHSEASRQRWEKFKAETKDSELAMMESDLLESWERRAAMLLPGQPDSADAQTLLEEAGIYNYEEIGMRFALAVLSRGRCPELVNAALGVAHKQIREAAKTSATQSAERSYENRKY